MEYEINVAKPRTTINDSTTTYTHYFRVIVPYGNVKKVYEELQEKYPDCKITITCWSKVGKDIDPIMCNF